MGSEGSGQEGTGPERSGSEGIGREGFSMTLADGSLKSTLRGILRRWEEADEAVRRTQAAKDGDPEAAERAKLEMAGVLWALEFDMSELLLMLLRAARTHNPDTLRLLLLDLIG